MLTFRQCFQVARRVVPVAVLAFLACQPPAVLAGYWATVITGSHSSVDLPAYLVPLLRFLLVVAVLRAANDGLNLVAQNNWRVLAAVAPSSSSCCFFRRRRCRVIARALGVQPDQMWDFPNEIAVVTGGAGGFGLSLVEGLTKRGVRVAVLDVVAPEAVPAALRDNALAAYFSCDVTSSSSVRAAAAAVRKHFGGQDPTILVNNAGVARRGTILHADEADVRRVLDVNLTALWFTTQEFLPGMLRQDKGHIVTVASLASFVAVPGAVEYSASKAGALAFHEGLASEIKNVHKSHGVLTSVVHPSFAKTPMTAPYADSIRRRARMLDVEDVTGPMLQQIFSGRGGQLVLPAHLTRLSGLRGWPSWAQEGLRDLLARFQ